MANGRAIESIATWHHVKADEVAELLQGARFSDWMTLEVTIKRFWRLQPQGKGVASNQAGRLPAVVACLGEEPGNPAHDIRMTGRNPGQMMHGAHRGVH